MIRLSVSTGARPFTLNTERSGGKHGGGGHFGRSARAKEWREAAQLLARHNGVAGVGLTPVTIRMRAVYPLNAGTLPDTGAIYPTEKAIVDGLVDAGVLPDDSGEHVRSITSEAPTKHDTPEPYIIVAIEADNPTEETP